MFFVNKPWNFLQNLCVSCYTVNSSSIILCIFWNQEILPNEEKEQSKIKCDYCGCYFHRSFAQNSCVSESSAWICSACLQFSTFEVSFTAFAVIWLPFAAEGGMHNWYWYMAKSFLILKPRSTIIKSWGWSILKNLLFLTMWMSQCPNLNRIMGRRNSCSKESFRHGPFFRGSRLHSEVANKLVSSVGPIWRWCFLQPCQ